MLENKRVLFFSADLFGYQTEICNCFQREGAIVDYYDERPANTFLVKALIRIKREILARYIDRYHSGIIEVTKNTYYDYIFIIKGESISGSSLRKLRECHPEAKLVLYLWDSIKNNQKILSNLSFFDKVFSFDKEDCSLYGFIFHPLFYIPVYKDLSNQEMADIDFLFIATVHSDRYEFCRKIEAMAKEKRRRCYFYFYFRSKILYYKMKLTNKAFRNTRLSDFHFTPLNKTDIIGLFKKSRIIVDIQHPNQSGLTMRCIETLGAKRKLITTNENIRTYDFFNANNILIVNRNKPVIPDEFIDSAYEDISVRVYEKYELKNWLKFIFFNNEHI